MTIKNNKRKFILSGILAFILIILLASFTLGCQEGYLLQAAKGHFEIMAARQSIPVLIKKGDLSADERQKLELVLEIRDFASTELGLPDNKSYRSLSVLDRDYPGWNVFAAEALSVTPKTWCYPIAGCVVYHGYFNQGSAERFAQKLQGEGFDVYVSPFSGYSTRGIQKDPILNIHLEYDSLRLAGLIFHELAHQQFYYPKNSTVSESFAVTVEQAGVRKWLRLHGQPQQLAKAEHVWKTEDQLTALVLKTRDQLDSLYRTDIEADEQLRQKNQTLDRFAEQTGFDRTRLNNAFFIPWGTYSDLVPEFTALLDSCGQDFSLFYEQMKIRYK